MMAACEQAAICLQFGETQTVEILGSSPMEGTSDSSPVTGVSLVKYETSPTRVAAHVHAERIPESVPARALTPDEHVVSTTGAPLFNAGRVLHELRNGFLSQHYLLKSPLLPLRCRQRDVAAVTQTAIGKDEALVNRGLVEVTSPSNSSPPSPTVTEDGRDMSDENAFLLAQPSPPEFKTDEMKSKRRRSVEVEDLGSDWEDVDGA
ncbi:hypothetical protein NMY22_g20013 [Coprinellus aureogranulatus]|nr:hypothetical protein NMY22_g20013 [Coprinellus aureogranulatus]